MKEEELRPEVIRRRLDSVIEGCIDAGLLEMCKEVKIMRSMYGDKETYKWILIHNEMTEFMTKYDKGD